MRVTATSLSAAVCILVLCGCAASNPNRAPRSEDRPPYRAVAPSDKQASPPVTSRATDASTDAAYYRERAAAFAAEVSAEIPRTDFLRFRRGRLYQEDAPDGDGPLQEQLTASFDSNDVRGILDATAAILLHDQADIRAHMLRAVALTRVGREFEARFHRSIAIALLASIAKTGDGRAFDSAWTVFRVKEEYEILKARGYIVEQQSLTTHNRRTFDVLQARAIKSNDVADWYFDVTELFAQRRRRFDR